MATMRTALCRKDDLAYPLFECADLLCERNLPRPEKVARLNPDLLCEMNAQ